MSPLRTVVPGATRACPHCRATVLESALRCPQCRKHLRSASSDAAPAPPPIIPFRVEGTIRAPHDDVWEYAVVVVVRDDAGAEVARHLVHVGALPADTSRTFTVEVEASVPVAGLAALRR